MINKFFKKITYIKIILIIVFLLSFILPFRTNAASLLLIPSSSSVSVGNIVSVKAYVNTEGISINNAEAVIQFPNDLLEVISITKSSSIFSLWVEEPSFSNSSGKINFNGGAPTPGYSGQSGYIATITFRAKKQGTASVLFTDGAVRANDGLGTNVLTSKSGNTIKIENSKVDTPKKEIVPKQPETNIVAETKPFNPIVVVIGNQNVIKFDDGDAIANVDYYTIVIDYNTSFKVKKNEIIDNQYYLPIQNTGNHILNITAFGKSGNYVESVLDFVSPNITSPVLSLGAKEITSGDSAVIYGKTDYPNKEVNVFLEFEGKQIGKYSQKTGNDGTFSITTDKIKQVGIVNISAETILGDSVISPLSEKIYLQVNEIAVVKVTLAIFYPLIGLIVISLLIIILLISLYAGWHKYFGLKKKLNKGLEHTSEEVHKAMLLLKEELNSQLGQLEKIKEERNLNRKEEKIFNDIKNNIDNIDDFIEKKLKKLL